MRTKVKADYVIGYENEKHILLKNSEIVYEGDTILYVGPSFPKTVDATIDMGNAILSPGFIDLNALGDIDHDSIHTEQPKHMQANLLWSKEYYDNGPKEFFFRRRRSI